MTLHSQRCETCEHHKIVGRIPDIDECDILDHTPTKLEIKLIEQIGCASYISSNQNVTRCYRCGESCVWLGSGKTYPRILDFKGYPACPAESQMPKEFRDDGP